MKPTINWARKWSQSAISGSFLIVSANCRGAKEVEEGGGGRSGPPPLLLLLPPPLLLHLARPKGNFPFRSNTFPRRFGEVWGTLTFLENGSRISSWKPIRTKQQQQNKHSRREYLTIPKKEFLKEEKRESSRIPEWRQPAVTSTRLKPTPINLTRHLNRTNRVTET